MTAAPVALWCQSALLPSGWAADVAIDVDETGNIAAVTTGAPAGDRTRLPGVVLPGMPNLHSHAFQRAMAGLAERRGPADDDFWTWREAMYRFVDRLDPDQAEAIATQLYVEMAKAGFTAVAEFHYLHNTPDGQVYHDPAEMGRRLARAAETAGLRLTLLPVLYQQAGFDGAPLNHAQRRFCLETDAWLGMIADLRSSLDPATQRTGMALHSLRAVSPEAMTAAVGGYLELDGFGEPDTAPIHIHIAEQIKEVDDCVAWSGARPVEWLLDNQPVGPRWVLVHATHMTDAETRAAAGSGAVAGLCPTTEANLGDGLFNLPDWLGAGGAFGIGSDSNVSVDPLEELRWLEYGQRLTRRQRVVAASEPGDSAGCALWQGALTGGAAALGQPIGKLAPGHGADFVAVDDSHPALAGRSGDTLLDSLVFTNAGAPILEVWIAGRRVVAEGRHPAEEDAAATYRRAIAALAGDG